MRNNPLFCGTDPDHVVKGINGFLFFIFLLIFFFFFYFFFIYFFAELSDKIKSTNRWFNDFLSFIFGEPSDKK